MESLQITAPGEVKLITSAPVPLREQQVRVSIERVGLCATDVHIFEGHFPKAEFPLVPGHEMCGRVSEIGPGVTGLTTGDLVAIDPAHPCGECDMCLRARPNLCRNRLAHGINQAGGMAQEVVTHAFSCHAFTKPVSVDKAVLTEPLACVVHGLSRVGPLTGRRVFIIGAGTIGLLAAEVARASSAESISIAEINPQRRELAIKHGFDVVSESLDQLKDSGRTWDVVIDATGVAYVINLGLQLLDRGGTYLQVGVADPEATITISPYQIFALELTIVGSLTTVGTFPDAVALIESGQVNLDGIAGPPAPLAEFASLVEGFSTQPHLKATMNPQISQT